MRKLAFLLVFLLALPASGFREAEGGICGQDKVKMEVQE